MVCQVQKFPSTDQMIEQIEKLCKKVSIHVCSITTMPACGQTQPMDDQHFLHSLIQVHSQVVDIFDNPDVVMAKFVQSLMERVLQV